MKSWIALAGALSALAGAATPVEVHGSLSVQGSKVVDAKGEPASLRGMSLFWSNWSTTFWNTSLVDWLASDWKVSVLRAPMGIEPAGAYLDRPGGQELYVRRVVDAAIARGIYVIVDWHDHHAQDHREQAVDFFRRMARDYGKHPNVIWEIFNEPEQVGWSVVKSYATPVIAAIRESDPDNLIIVGTPEWSAKVDLPATDPIPGRNIAYTLHFYAASHGAWLRDRSDAAMASGIALFATEWGTCEYTGDGRLGTSETREWLDWMDSRGVSWANWSVFDKDETCSALTPGANNKGSWISEEISASGSLVREAIRSRNGWYGDLVTRVDTFVLPGTIDAQSPSALEGPVLEDDATGSGRHLAYIDDGSAAEWTVRVATAQTISTSVRVASENAGGSIRWTIDGAEAARSTVSGTGGWQTWANQEGPSFPIPAGTHRLRLEFTGSGTGLFNLDAIETRSGPLSVTRPRSSASWHLAGGNLLVRGAGNGIATLRDLRGRLLVRTPIVDGTASLRLPGREGTFLLELPDEAARRVPVVR